MKETIDILWILVAAGLVFIMQAGFAMVESGLTRSKNSINVAIKNLTDAGLSIFLFWVAGFALMFGPSLMGLVGHSGFFFEVSVPWDGAFFFFQAVFCSTAATIVSGAVAERMRYSSYIIVTILIGVLIYPVFGHWSWGGALTGSSTGWLGSLGFVDFAGSTVVHSVGGWVALAGVLILGPRMGRFDTEGKPVPIMGSNVSVSVFGVMILWFGWLGFNGGSTLAMNDAVSGIIARTSIAAASGMVATLAIGWFLYRRPEVSLVINGTLAGLVAITAPAHAVTAMESAFIGSVGGLFMLVATIVLEHYRIDDAVGAIPVHLAAGIWGTLAVALFGDPKILGTGLSLLDQLGVQALGIGAAGLWAFGVAYILLWIVNRIIPLRVTPEEERDGLNFTEHNAVTELHNLFHVMEQQADEGNLSLRVPEEPFTEAGMIAHRYNRVLDSLESSLEEKQKEENARKQSEDRYRYLVEGADAVIFTLDQQGLITSMNSTIKKILRIPPEKTLGTSFYDHIHLSDRRSQLQRKAFFEQMEQLVRDGKPVEFTAFFRSPTLIDPEELRVRMERIEINGTYEILGRGYRVTDDALSRYIGFEKIRFNLGNMLTTLEEMTFRLTRMLKKHFEQNVVNQVRIALREILINAVEHGNLEVSFVEKTGSQVEDRYIELIKERQEDPRYRERMVTVDYMYEDERVVYRVTDQGNGFDHQKVLSADPGDINENMLEHGRGLLMVKDAFDEVTYNNKGNQVLLVKKLVPGT